MSKVSIIGGAACVAALVFLAACGGGGSRASTPSQPPVLPGPGPQPPLPPPPPPPPTTPPPDPAPGGRFPLMFVTQVAISGTDFARITGTFANHDPGNANDTPRGGDLMIAYPKADGTFDLRNLTREAGFGMKDPNTPETASCAANMVAVREPAVSWDASKALVSMVVGCGADKHWQIFEVEGLLQGQTAKFTHLDQPEEFNNISPIYSPEGDSGTEFIIYSSDMSWHGRDAKHLKCLDEYEEKRSTCGLFKLDRAGEVTNLDPSPSGSFTPTIDSFGRVIFTRWDHMENDQQEEDNNHKLDLFNWVSEAPGATTERFTLATKQVQSVFPERKFAAEDGFAQHEQKPFLMWQINVDGTGAETLNHFGRQEFKFIRAARSGDARQKLGLRDNNSAGVGGNNVDAFRFLREDPRTPGRYFALLSPEFGTCSGGAVVTIDSAPDVLPKDMEISYITSPDTYDADSKMLFRSPMGASNGEIWASASTSHKLVDFKVTGCDYRLARLVKQGEFFVPGGNVTAGAGLQRILDGKTETLWEWDVVEVRARDNKPAPALEPPLEAGEMNAFEAVFGVGNGQKGLTAFRAFLKKNKLALAVVRNVTWREQSDFQQPFNLSVPSLTDPKVTTKRTNSTVDMLAIDHLQIFTGQQLRGTDGDSELGSAKNYRRVLAQPAQEIQVQDNTGTNTRRNVNVPAAPGVAPASVKISTVDGSVAFIVEANRPTAWQSINSAEPGDPVLRTDGRVRERYWIGFQPGEIRMCPACHGGLDQDKAQNGKTFAELKALGNKPDTKTDALVELLTYYKATFFTGF